MSQQLIPPFTAETARVKVQKAEDACNTRPPEVVAQVYSDDSNWRNRDEYFNGKRTAHGQFVTPEAVKWQYTHGVRNEAAIGPDNWNVNLRHLSRGGYHAGE